MICRREGLHVKRWCVFCQNSLLYTGSVTSQNEIMSNLRDELAQRLGEQLADAMRSDARGRSYPVAWSSVKPQEPGEPCADSGRLTRPPPGTASVRPSVPAPQPSMRAGDDVLSNAADSAFFSKNESGEATFELMISDELFENLRCSITVGKGGVNAVFHVGSDQDLRRLLEAESGRPRASLEAKGLRSVTVSIETE